MVQAGDVSRHDGRAMCHQRPLNLRRAKPRSVRARLINAIVPGSGTTRATIKAFAWIVVMLELRIMTFESVVGA